MGVWEWRYICDYENVGMQVWEWGAHGFESLVEVVEEVNSEWLQCLALEGGGDVGEKETLCEEAITEGGPLGSQLPGGERDITPSHIHSHPHTLFIHIMQVYQKRSPKTHT